MEDGCQVYDRGKVSYSVSVFRMGELGRGAQILMSEFSSILCSTHSH